MMMTQWNWNKRLSRRWTNSSDMNSTFTKLINIQFVVDIVRKVMILLYVYYWCITVAAVGAELDFLFIVSHILSNLQTWKWKNMGNAFQYNAVQYNTTINSDLSRAVVLDCIRSYICTAYWKHPQLWKPHRKYQSTIIMAVIWIFKNCGLKTGSVLATVMNCVREKLLFWNHSSFIWRDSDVNRNLCRY